MTSPTLDIATGEKDGAVRICGLINGQIRLRLDTIASTAAIDLEPEAVRCAGEALVAAADKVDPGGRRLLDPVPLILYCPECNRRHIDRDEFAKKPHHTHACQNCGHCWRPAVVPTVGVRFLPGFGPRSKT